MQEFYQQNSKIEIEKRISGKIEAFMLSRRT